MPQGKGSEPESQRRLARRAPGRAGVGKRLVAPGPIDGHRRACHARVFKIVRARRRAGPLGLGAGQAIVGVAQARRFLDARAMVAMALCEVVQTPGQFKEHGAIALQRDAVRPASAAAGGCTVHGGIVSERQTALLAQS